jgi:membrane complex biogenesis BtpA family protein
MRNFPEKFLAAMIAVEALPGAPRYEGNDEKIIQRALEDLEIYQKVGVDSVLLENDHDLPYIKPPLPKEAVDLMTKIAKEVRKKSDKPIGIQMLEAANITSLKIAKDADLDFIRVEGFVFAQIGGAGLIEGSAGKLLRKKKELGCEHIRIFADVEKKHAAHAITGDLSIEDEIKQAEFFLADGIIITSKFTGTNPKATDLKSAKKTTKLAIIIGSGMTPENIKTFMPLADGFIVGSTFRKNGKFLEQIDPNRLDKFINNFKKARKKYL